MGGTVEAEGEVMVAEVRGLEGQTRLCKQLRLSR